MTDGTADPTDPTDPTGHVAVAAPAANTRFRLPLGPAATVRSLWSSRRLLGALAGRQLRVRYTHTLLGPLWALLSIAVPLVVLLVLRSRLAAAGGAARSLAFLAVALVPWSFFAAAASAGATSLLTDSSVVTRVREDRAVFPLSRVVVAAVDAAIGAVAVLVVAGVRRELHVSAWALVAVPVLLAAAAAAAAGAALLLSILVALVRDARHVTTLVLQFGLFFNPILFSLREVPARLRLPYVAVDPIAGVIDGLRAVLVSGTAPSVKVTAVTLASSAGLLVVGLVAFRRAVPRAIDVA